MGYSFLTKGQSVISIRPVLNGSEIDTVLGNEFHEGLFYLSKLQGYFHVKTEGKLVDVSDTWLFNFAELEHGFQTKGPTSLMFGVDSALNFQGVHGGDLDPIHGMYWTWQTGYIHCKIEGIFINGEKQIPIVFHLGGFDSFTDGPFEIAELKKDQSTLILDLGPAINWALENGVNQVMSPGKKADAISNELVKGMRLL